MKIATWNVNGLRAVLNKGFLDWVKKTNPDIFNLQETKVSLDKIPEEISALSNYHPFWSTCTLPKKSGYSGVASFSQRKPIEAKLGLGVEKFDSEGRTITLHYPEFILINGYFPNGQRDHNRVPFKLEYSRTVLSYALELEKEKKLPVIICGDINTAHHEIDLKNAKGNKNTTGFLPHERVFIDEVLQSGFVDIFRELHPNQPDHYTWWTYRGDCRERNIGWRIDYFFMSKSLRKKVKNCYHQTEVMGSDHCPVVLELDV